MLTRLWWKILGVELGSLAVLGSVATFMIFNLRIGGWFRSTDMVLRCSWRVLQVWSLRFLHIRSLGFLHVRFLRLLDVVILVFLVGSGNIWLFLNSSILICFSLVDANIIVVEKFIKIIWILFWFSIKSSTVWLICILLMSLFLVLLSVLLDLIFYLRLDIFEVIWYSLGRVTWLTSFLFRLGSRGWWWFHSFGWLLLSAASLIVHWYWILDRWRVLLVVVSFLAVSFILAVQ